MSPFNADGVLLRESLGGTSTRFEADHAAALLAYPGTVWSEVAEEAPASAQGVTVGASLEDGVFAAIAEASLKKKK